MAPSTGWWARPWWERPERTGEPPPRRRARALEHRRRVRGRARRGAARAGPVPARRHDDPGQHARRDPEPEPGPAGVHGRGLRSPGLRAGRGRGASPRPPPDDLHARGAWRRRRGAGHPRQPATRRSWDGADHGPGDIAARVMRELALRVPAGDVEDALDVLLTIAP